MRGKSRLQALPRPFYDRSPEGIARELLGKVLVRRAGRKTLTGRIVEAEAYLGLDDPAAHAYAGKTVRNQVLFGPPGHAYVYFIYGMYYCLNASCEPEGHPGCVLIRALEPLSGIAEMAGLRDTPLSEPPSLRQLRLLTSGPGRLCSALDINRDLNGADLCSQRSRLWIGDDGFRPAAITESVRVGITKAAERELRYAIAGNAFVSR